MCPTRGKSPSKLPWKRQVDARADDLGLDGDGDANANDADGSGDLACGNGDGSDRGSSEGGEEVS